MALQPHDILNYTSHRPDALAKGRWRYYQEWNDALFLHWKVDAEALQSLLPCGLVADTFRGQAWVSLVVFTMNRIRPRLLPAVPWVSDFHEINVRTYVRQGERGGVYFLNIEAGKQQSVLLARLLSGLPYEQAKIIRQENACRSYNRQKGFRLDLQYETGEKIQEVSAADTWLCERYGLYLHKGGQLFYYPVHHLPWELYGIRFRNSLVSYGFGDILLDKAPDLAHYSPGVQVLAWPKKPVR